MNFFKNNKLDNLFIYFLIIYPFLIFFFNNLNQLYHLTRLTYIGSFLLIFPLIFTCFILLNIKNTIVVKYRLPLLISVLWFIQFYFLNIRSFISNLGDQAIINIIDGYIAILIIILLSVIITFLLKYQYFKKFIFLFLIINLFLSFITNFNFFSETKKNSLPNKHYKNISIDHNSNSPNVYYIVMDGLTSGNFLKEKFGFDSSLFEKKLEKKGFIIAENAKSTYNASYLSISSIFYADYFLNEKSDEYYDTSNFYPTFFTFEKRPPLLTYLNKKNYKFILFSSSWGRCKNNYNLNCIFADGNIIGRILNDYGFFTFITKTMIPSIAVKLNIKFLDQNDTVKILQKKIEKDYTIWEGGSVFTFVHSLIPHAPYRYENCIINENAKDTFISYPLKDEMKYYVSSVQCAFLRMEEITEIIMSKDKDAIIVLQADHGTSIFNEITGKETISEETVAERINIFNAALLPENCKNKFNNEIGNVGTIQLVLSCIGIDIPNIELSKPRSYIGFYQNSESFGKVYRVK